MPPQAWLLHYGASSALGRALISIARARRTKIINIVRRAEAVAELKDIGCAPLAMGTLQ